MYKVQLLNDLLQVATLHDAVAVVGSSGARQQLRHVGRQPVTRAFPKDPAAGCLQPIIRYPPQFTQLLESHYPRAFARKDFDESTREANEENMCEAVAVNAHQHVRRRGSRNLLPQRQQIEPEPMDVDSCFQRGKLPQQLSRQRPCQASISRGLLHERHHYVALPSGRRVYLEVARDCCPKRQHEPREAPADPREHLVDLAVVCGAAIARNELWKIHSTSLPEAAQGATVYDLDLWKDRSHQASRRPTTPCFQTLNGMLRQD